jgi:3-keto-L-gulonate-6-phosphate decarboxylase
MVTGLGDGGEKPHNADIIRVGTPFKAYYGMQAIGVFQSIALPMHPLSLEC